MMIKCLIVGKDRHISIVKIDARKANFNHNNGLYTVPKEAVNLAEFEDGKTEGYPELIYIEGTPLPVNYSEGNVAGFLEQTVIANALKQVVQAKSNWVLIVADYARNPSKLIILAFVGIILAAVIGAFLFP